MNSDELLYAVKKFLEAGWATPEQIMKGAKLEGKIDMTTLKKWLSYNIGAPVNRGHLPFVSTKRPARGTGYENYNGPRPDPGFITIDEMHAIQSADEDERQERLKY